MSVALPLELQGSDFDDEYQSSTGAVVDRVFSEFAHSSDPAIRQLPCECHGAIVTIAGRLPSFYQKQVAISLVIRCLPKGTHFDDDIDIAHGR